jgi:hypothetical protein
MVIGYGARVQGAPRIRYLTGNEHAPDDPFGRIVLVLDPAGLVRLGNWSRGGVRAWGGTVALGVVDRVLAHLRAGGFPERPRSITPSALFTLSLETDPPQSVMDSIHTANAGYREALQLLHCVIRQLSGDEIPVGRPPEEALVHGARSIDIDDVK